MTWLYVPETSSPSAQASAGSSSESFSPFTPEERLVAGSVTWRGKPLPLPAWSRRWKAGGFIRHLSGLTCSPSTLDRGVASFISSLRETPARTTASPESAPGPMESGSSPPRSAVSPMSAGLILSSARTSRGTPTGNSQPSSRHWSDWATSLRLEYSARPRPEIPCGASDYSSWPSASAVDSKGARNRTAARSNPNSKHHDGVTLNDAVYQWAAPDLGCNKSARAMTASKNNGRRSGGGQSSPPGLEQMARIVTGDIPEEMLAIDLPAATAALISATPHWAAPQARDHFPPHSPERIAAMKAEGHGMRNLNDEAAQWESPGVALTEGSRLTRGGDRCGELLLSGQAAKLSADFRPPSFPDQPIAGGSMSSTDGPNTNQPSAKRKLNPIFVEALMRWPTGLSGFERQETAWTRWWLLMPSFVSALCSQRPEAQGNLF